MSEQAVPDMVSVVVGIDPDYERPFAYRDDHDPDVEHMYAARVPAALLDRLDAAGDEYEAAVRAVCEAAGLDVDEGRLRERCPEWTGYETQRRTLWRVVLAASGDPDTWPVVEHDLDHADSREDAEARIAALPERFAIAQSGARLALVDRSRLYVSSVEVGGYSSLCHRCGHPRDEHDDRGVDRG